MLRLDESILRAIVNLEQTQDYDTLKQWLTRSYHAQLRENIDIAPDTPLRWGQGKAQCLGEIIDELDNARKTLQKMKQ